MNSNSNMMPRIPANTDTLVAHALDKFTSPERWPYTARDFFRLDRGDDSEFYAEPRLVKHLDDKALGALTDFYSRAFPQESLIECLYIYIYDLYIYICYIV